ncbi:DUF4440 domain-containing protein [Halalkalibacillus sediminis]|uniref:DUF4440 domain-containing protein n=1 Tax=Halalkalibacillus sediminis TaxID=2018042 RepID=A0A2I0QSR5_9BACI|nr:DUF4440 domain-containing protein [Halalkalibacillus sediminis]PKR77359.1 DUF4440 domain-containing protein [Halalkalibacillus sediminis]
MEKEALKEVERYRTTLNNGDVHEINRWISDDFIGYFGYYNDVDYEIYDGDSYKKSNVETINSYNNQSPVWEYNDLTNHLRSEDEMIFSSIIDFYLSGEKVASALAMEVFKKEKDGWKLFRQHMERY